MATIHNFHSFIKLVRLMYNEQQTFFKQGRRDSNLQRKCMQLEAKVDKQIHEFHPQTTCFYEWQPKFIQLIKALRIEQKMFFQTRSEGSYTRSKGYEKNLDDWLTYLETKYPNIFIHVEEAKQKQLF